MKTERVPRKLFGDLYNNLVLTQESVSEQGLFGTVCPGETQLLQTLFGWQIVLGKDQITCDNELEARFLRIFVELGWKNVLVPTNEKYLAEILPEFESLKNRADELYKKREKTIFSRKLRREVKTKFYRMISQTLDEQSRQPRARTVQVANTAG